MQSKSLRDTWVEINLNHIKHNIKEILSLYQSDKKVYAVVKADAYGYGDIEVSKAAIEAGAKGLAVAILDEAIRLREVFPDIPILVLGWTSPQHANLAAEHDITLTIFQLDWVKEVKAVLKHENLQVHLKIDTGMGRIGIRSIEEAYDVITECSSSNVKITGLYTHLATADHEKSDYVHYQISAFKDYVKEIESMLPTPVEKHIGNSAASIVYSEEMFDAIRLGLGMYGLYPTHTVKDLATIELKPSFSLYSRLIHVKQVKKGDYISYSQTYQAEEDEWIGTIPIGYGDGLPRRLQNFQVLINGEKATIVGRICMDQTMVKLKKPYKIGTKVTFIGQDQNEQITMEEMAEYLGTIPYEVSCHISKRVPRIYT